ncbi:hypothetical protein ACUXAI_002065 [Sphingomonas sanguinis]
MNVFRNAPLSRGMGHVGMAWTIMPMKDAAGTLP